MASEPRQRLTVQEYLAFERQSEVRHEYLEGEVFAMSGGSRQHNRIAFNVAKVLDATLPPSCRVYLLDMRLKTPDTGFFTYPDVAVVCGNSRFEDSKVDTLLNPALIVEVLSPSTERYDRGSKFLHYRSIPSLACYVLVSQDRVHVECFVRQDDGGWSSTELEDLAETLELPSIGCRLPLAAVYDRAFSD